MTRATVTRVTRGRMRGSVTRKKNWKLAVLLTRVVLCNLVGMPRLKNAWVTTRPYMLMVLGRTIF